MGLALYSIIKSLKNGGVAGIVTERGVLNNGTDTNSWQKKLRKYLMENTNIKEITLLPKGIFSYTNFDTAIIIFEKGKKTEKIIFNEGYFKDEEKGKGNKTLFIKNNILTITLKDIINKDWSLKYDDYVEKKENLHKGVEYKTLGEVCNFIGGKTISKEVVEKNTGEYPVIGGGIKPFGYYNKYNINENAILVSKSGANAGYISKYKTKVWASDCFSLQYIDEELNIDKFLFYYLKLNQSNFIKKQEEGGMQSGNAQPHVYEKDLKKFKIPILTKEHQEEIVKCIEKIFGKDYKELDKMVSKLKDYDLFYPLLNKNYDDFEKLYDNYKDIVNLEKIYDDREELKRALIKKCFKTVKGVEKTLGEVCKIERGKSLPKSKMNAGKIPVITGCANINNYHDNSNFIASNNIFMARVGSAGDVFKMSGNVYLTDLAFVIQAKNINNDYLFYFLKNFNNLIKQICANNGPPNINTSILCKKLIVSIPSPEDQEKVVKMIEEIEKKESDYNKSIESIKKLVETIYTNVEMKCSSITTNTDDIEEDNISKTSTISSKSLSSSKSVKTYKINGIKCIKEGDKYYDFDNKKLFAITNDEGEIELVEEEKEEYNYITIGKKDYILIDENVYTIANDEPGELYGTYKNGKFTKINNDKIIVKGRKQQEKTEEELETELGL